MSESGFRGSTRGGCHPQRDGCGAYAMPDTETAATPGRAGRHPRCVTDYAEGHVPGTSCARCPASLPQEAHPAVPVHERSRDPTRTSSRPRTAFSQLKDVANASDVLGERISPEISAGHPRSTLGRARNLLRVSSDQRRNRPRRTRRHRLTPHGTPGHSWVSPARYDMGRKPS